MRTTEIFKCNQCTKSFRRKGDLTRHCHLHNNLKPYVCEFCKRAFAQSSGLKTHRNTHTKAKPHKCGYPGCDAAFGDPSSCARHKKERHINAGGYQCLACPFRIKRLSLFKQHLMKHGVDPVQVEISEMVIPSVVPATAQQLQLTARCMKTEVSPSPNPSELSVQLTVPFDDRSLAPDAQNSGDLVPQYNFGGDVHVPDGPHRSPYLSSVSSPGPMLSAVTSLYSSPASPPLELATPELAVAVPVCSSMGPWEAPSSDGLLALGSLYDTTNPATLYSDTLYPYCSSSDPMYNDCFGMSQPLDVQWGEEFRQMSTLTSVF
ncbi:hypothetical protein FISHEDRAFT_72779 [Fistulina hepatica ATCC 64428]|nr:hypothetical protein FISHEDRAFT_72779 [Fistulina hepatica ATCC 64428]